MKRKPPTIKAMLDYERRENRLTAGCCIMFVAFTAVLFWWAMGGRL